MPKSFPIVDVVEEMFQSVLASPKRQRRLLSKTFWGRFGFKVRTKERVGQIRSELERRNLMINLDEESFGTEDKDEWIILTQVEPPLPDSEPGHEPTVSVQTPPDSWFDLMENREFESEREVEHYFVVPLLERLGYEEDDIAVGHAVEMFEGTTKTTKQADVAVFDGRDRSRGNILLVVETKRFRKPLTRRVIGQVRSYALWLHPVYYFVTNGEETRVYLFQGALQPDVEKMSFGRNEIQRHWTSLYEATSKAAVISRKQQILKS